MNKEERSIKTIYEEIELETLLKFLIDFDVVLQEKEAELQEILNKSCLDSIKKNKINQLHIKMIKYETTLKTFKDRADFFNKIIKDNSIDKDSSFYQKANEFSKKVKKYYSKVKNQIKECDDYLSLDNTF